jgi:hypothetical protein
MSLVVVARYWNLSEAYVAAGALRSAGIRAEVFDDQYGSMWWTQQPMLGGYRLVAPENETAEACDLLRSALGAAAVEAQEAVRPPRLPWAVAFALVALNPYGVMGWLAATRRPALWKTVGFVLFVLPGWLVLLLGPAALVLNLRDVFPPAR